MTMFIVPTLKTGAALASFEVEVQLGARFLVDAALFTSSSTPMIVYHGVFGPPPDAFTRRPIGLRSL